MTFRATRWILKHGIRENIMYVVFLNTTLSKFKYHACDNQSAHDIKEVCNVNMGV